MQAWPPSSTKTNAVLVTKEDVENEVVAAYENEATQNRPHCDTDAIADRVRGQTAFDLVLRQTVRNGQGANVMVLSQRKTVVSLDLYQAKHYNKFQRTLRGRPLVRWRLWVSTMMQPQSVGTRSTRNRRLARPGIATWGYIGSWTICHVHSTPPLTFGIVPSYSLGGVTPLSKVPPGRSLIWKLRNTRMYGFGRKK